MTAFVFDDADYYFPHSGYQVEGVLGYPALAAMGRLTVSDNTIQVDPAKEIDPASGPGSPHRRCAFLSRWRSKSSSRSARHRIPTRRFTSQGACSRTAAAIAGESDDRMFAIDAGGQQTYLTSRWFDEHAAEFNGQKMQSSLFPAWIPDRSLPTSPKMSRWQSANHSVDLHYIRVLTQPLGSAARDDVYGVIGIDALDQLKSYTFDYRTMRFSAKGEIGKLGTGERR